ADTVGSETRYRLLETVRQYAQDRLDDSGETQMVRAAHARWYATFLEQAAADVHGGRSVRGDDWVVYATDNVRAALASAIDAGDVDPLLRFFTLQASWLVAPEITYEVQSSAARAAQVPGVSDDPRYPLVLAEGAFFAAQRGDLSEMARFREALDSCETPL